MIVGGTLFPLTILIILAVTLYISTQTAKRGKVFEYRKLPAIDALEEAVGRAVETGGPVHWCMGTGRGRSLTTGISAAATASFAILRATAHLCARLGAVLLPSIGQPEGIPIVDAICREAYTLENAGDQWDSENIEFFPDKSYKIGVPARISQEQVKANILVGYSVSETILIAETAAAVGAFQIGGTTAWNNICYCVTSCDYVLIGEEIFAAGVYLSEDPVERGSLIGQDISKLIFIATIVLATTLLAFGSDLLVNLLKL